MGGAIAALISRHLPGTEATAEVTTASVNNRKLIHTGRVALAFTLPDTAWDDYNRKLKGLNERSGSATDVLSGTATCAAARIIVGVVTLTGLGLKFSLIILALAGNSLFLTALYTALTVWVLGLAVLVTHPYIIAAVITAPARVKLGVPEFAAHMFIFTTLYYPKSRHPRHWPPLLPRR